MIKKVTHITIFVHNQDDALAFYTDKLGFKLHTDAMLGADFRWLTVAPEGQPDFEIALLAPENDFERALVGKQAGEKPLLAVETDDCAKSVKELKEKGVVVLEGPSEAPWGIYALFTDLEGNVFHLNQPQ